MDEDKTPEQVLVNCKTISGIITQQHGNHKYLASPILDDLKHIHCFLLKEVSTSFGRGCDEDGNLVLSELHREVAYGILPELVSHALKMDAQADGDFAKMYMMVIDIFCCLIAVCSVELMAFLFSTFASLLLYFNEKKPPSSTSELRSAVMYKLCYYMFPLCLTHPRSEGSLCHAMVPAILGSVLDTCSGEDMKWCTQMLDVLMSSKKDICLDIITLISSGTKRVRKQAEKILMHYWLTPHEGRNGEEILKAWQLEKCRMCHRMADMVCVNPACGIHDNTEDRGFYLCNFCHANSRCGQMFPIAKPIGFENRLSGSCQLRLDRCIGTAVLACFHPDCVSLVKKTNQSFVRMCSECVASCHVSDDCNHIFQDGLQCPWTCQNSVMSITLLGALSKLLDDVLSACQNKSKENRSIDCDSTTAVLLLDQYCQCPAYELDDDMHNWMVHLVSLVLNWLYEIINQEQFAAVENKIIPWLIGVLHQEAEYVAEAVLPNLPEYAQVGRLWNSVHSMVERRRHTLEIIEMLQGKILTGSKADGFYLVFDTIMPFWLKELSGSPDQLESLKEYFKKLFEVSKDDEERKRKFEFVKIAFNDQDVQKMKEALCWLQALTRMDIGIPFLKDMIQQAAQKPSLSKLSSFDVKASSRHISAVPYRRSSWSDSEHSDASTISGLMTHSSVEYTGDILDVDSTLTRYILMLDVWLSQIKLVNKDFSAFQFSDIQNIVLCMLKESHNWGTYHNHNCPSEICLLCYAIVLWFNLANLIFEEYTTTAPLQCPDDEEDSVQPAPRNSRTSFFSKFFAMRRAATLQEHPSPESRPSVASSSGSVNEQSSQGIPASPIHEKPQVGRRERKMARMDTHTNYTLVSQALQAKKKVDSTGTLYKIFQECLKWWRPATFIPEATYQVILFITTLFRNSKLLHDETSYSTCITDVEKLITNLWNSLICEYTYLAKAAVILLCECLEVLSVPADVQAKDMDLQQIKFRSMVDSKFEQDSYTKRFEVVEKAFLIVQFVENVKKLSSQTQLSLSYVFCHLVGSLQDSSSHVATRAQYCLRSLKQSALVGIQDAMSFSFNKYANHRSQILMTMSILNSHLPDCNIPTSPIKFLVGLEPYLKLLKECHADIPKRKKGKTEERLSMASHSVEVMNKYLKSDASNAAILQQMLALLMQILADRRFKTSLLEEGIELPLFTSPVLIEKGLGIIMEFFRLIVCQYFMPLPAKLRESHFFETYLRNIYQVLDINTAFGNSPEVLSFNLRLLVFSACSSYDESHFLAERLRQKKTSLALLDPSLCLAWLKVFFVICYKYVDQILESEEKEKLQDGVLACVVITLKTLERSPHHCIPPPHQKFRSYSVAASVIQEQAIFRLSTVASRNPSVVSTDSGSSSVAVPNSRQVGANKCPLCNDAIITVHGEEIITQCVVTLSTALHHMPVLTLRYLIDSINALARVALPDAFSWDNTSKVKDQAPISASNTAKQYLKCLLTQHGDRNLFLYLFKYCDSKALMQAIFSSLPPPVVEQENSANLGEGEDSSNKNVKVILNQISPVQYFLEDLSEEPNILRRSNVIINLSNYLHFIKDSNGKKSLVFLIPKFEFFFEKVKQVPKTVDAEAYNALIKIMILVTEVLKEYPPKHGLIQQSLLFQQFSSYYSTILLMGFKHTLLPLHGLVVLFKNWYHLLESHSMSFANLDNMMFTMNNELVQVLKQKFSNAPPGNFITLVKFFILCFHGNVGYIDDIFNNGKTIFCRDLHENPFFTHVATTLCHQSTLLECLGFLCCRLSINLVHVYEFKLHVSKLLVTNLCSSTPSKVIVSRLQQIDATLSASEDRTVQSVLKTSTSFLVALGWVMIGAMKLVAMRQIFSKQLAEATHGWEADDISSFLYRIWNGQPLSCVNDVVNSTLSLIVRNPSSLSSGLDAVKNVFLFLEIWTVYLEVVVPKGEDSTVFVIEVWRNVIKQISSIPMLDTTVSILHHLNKAVAHIKRANLHLTTKITPFWRETRRMGDKAQYCAELWRDVGDTEATVDTGFNASGGEITVDQSQKQTNCCSGQHGLDTWYNCALQRLSNMETDYRNDIMGQ